MDQKESLKHQIDTLAAEQGVPPGYAKNASVETLEKRLTELEQGIPDDGEPELEQTGDQDSVEQLEPEQAEEQATQPEPEAEPAPLLQTGERVTSGTQRITATRTFKDDGDWVKAGETITVTADVAAKHIQAGRAVRQL